MPAKRKLVLIEWIDSASVNDSAWRDLETMIEHAHHIRCLSVGWLMKETKDNLLLVPHIAAVDEVIARQAARGEMNIPKCCVVKRTTLLTRVIEAKETGNG